MAKIGFNVGGNKKGKAAKKPAGKSAPQKKGSKPNTKKPPGKAKPKKKGKQPFLTPEYNTSELGRPQVYTKEIGEKICELIATSSKGLLRICSDNEDLPSGRTVYRWLSKGSEKDAPPEMAAFCHSYARAREWQAMLLNDEINEIADNNRFDRESFVGINHVQRAKVMIDARKITSARLNPKKYGSKVDVTSDGDKVGNVQIFIPDNGRNKKP